MADVALLSAALARKLKALVARRFVGRGGIDVVESESLVSISLRPELREPGGGGGGGLSVSWMKLTVVSAATLKGKLCDVNGDVGQNPEETINVLVSGASGLITTGFNFNTCAPKLAVNNIVPVIKMVAAGTTRPAGYWLAWYVSDTCAV
jgi:hypothetical protein